MFTGIITDIGRVASVERAEDGSSDTVVGIETAYDTATIDLGASVAVSGCCLTVISRAPEHLTFQVSAETLSKTTLGRFEEGTAVNLERALRAGDELGGHLVSGHVDGTAAVVSRTPEGDSLRLVFEAPGELARFIAPKGSVALDGVSLTVNEVDGAAFGVNIIPHTQSETTLGWLVPDAAVNLEIDMLARYVARLLEVPGTTPGARGPNA